MPFVPLASQYPCCSVNGTTPVARGTPDVATPCTRDRPSIPGSGMRDPPHSAIVPALCAMHLEHTEHLRCSAGYRIRYLMRVQVALRSANAENSTLMTGLCTLTTAGPYVTEIFKIFNPSPAPWRGSLPTYSRTGDYDDHRS